MVREDDRNPELRTSLRSLTNLRHDRVWIAGHRPAWVAGVEHLAVEQDGVKHENTWAIWRAIAGCPDISDEFVMLHDDMFVLQPLDRVPALHAGPLDLWLAGLRPESPTARRMRDTREALTALGRRDLLSWELHVPMVMDRRWLAEMVAFVDHRRARLGGDPPCKRTMYAGYAGLAGGVEAADCKIRDKTTVPGRGDLFASTLDGTFRYGQAGRWLRDRFPARSVYEAERVAA